MKMLLRCWVVPLCVLLLGSYRAVSEEFVPPPLIDGERTEISLLTVGLGKDMAARFGHTMIRVKDPGARVDYLVNWGVFDFSDPLFLPRFLRGYLYYRMGFSAYQPTLRYYRDFEKRPVREDLLVLTPSQKKKLIDKIIWNAQPENIHYRYLYFANNCATMPRDYLDEVLHGVISNHYRQKLTGTTFRHYMRSNFAISSVAAWGIDVFANSDSDHEITAWQEMFYPAKLREYLATLPSIDDQGQEIPGTRLLVDRGVVVQATEPDPFGFDGYKSMWLFAFLPMMLLIFSHLQSRRRMGWLNVEPAHWQWRVFGAVSVLWALTCGFFGLVITLGWAFSEHTDFYRNVNLWLLWPCDILIVRWAFPMLFSGHLGALVGRRQRFWRVAAGAHLAAIGIYLVAVLSGFSQQSVDKVMLHMLPSILVYYLILFYVTRPDRDALVKH